MKQNWLSRSGTDELLLIFGGWALGPAPFEGLNSNTDVLFVDDYTRLDDPLNNLAQYDRVTLFAFSFGVASAAHWMAQTGKQPDRLIAACGTLSPANADHGIAPDTVRGTADHLDPANFAKFCRRAGLEGSPPELDFTAARAELYAVIERGPAPAQCFDRIWIPQRDRIIPTRAQQAAWSAQPDAIRLVSAPHVPFRSGQSWQEWIA